jgi:hypothetical protein
MNRTREQLSTIWHHFQIALFPGLEQEVGELTSKQQQLIDVLEFSQFERYLPEFSGYPGRPLKSRSSIARAFAAKAVYNMATTEILIDRLESGIKRRCICGWEKIRDILSSSTFSRAFDEFSAAGLDERVHAGIIEAQMSEQLVGHISRDSAAIVGREKPIRKAKAAKDVTPKKRGRPKKGEEIVKEPTRLERQLSSMTRAQVTSDLPTCLHGW